MLNVQQLVPLCLECNSMRHNAKRVWHLPASLSACYRRHPGPTGTTHVVCGEARCRWKGTGITA